jgi:hypothetical protein
MRNAKVIAAASVILIAVGCNAPEPARDTTAEPARADTAAADAARERNDEAAEMEKRIVELERRWTEMEGKLAANTVKATAALRAEVKEDVTNVRAAIGDLKTTTPQNWWERHERAMEQTADDIEADVRPLAKGQAAPKDTTSHDTAAAAAPFESRRDQFVARLRARTDRMDEQLKNVKADGVKETELKDTRARVDKLQDDIDRLGKASADDWWDISAARVRDYIDRVEDSIERLDNNKT